MSILSGLVVLTLAVLSAVTADDVIGNGKCVTIMVDDLVMHERKPDQQYPYYLYMITKDKEYNDQRWILESTGDGYFKLKNKHSNRYAVIGTFDYLLTADDAVRAMDHFKFVSDGAGKYDIVNKINQHPESQGKNLSVKKSAAAQHFTVQSCQE
uniref:Erythema protein SVEP-1 n=1 Tax=Simulium nigrimanum TaxID=683695 RepID=D1FQ46_SIMNI